jgi:hypothetical protein
MRKLLLSIACLAATVPAVALAADETMDSTEVTGTTPRPEDGKIDARQKAKGVQVKLKRTRERAEARRERQRGGGAQANGGATTPAHLQAIAACESGGDPRAIGGGGAYRGKYQFDHGTWASVGGSGYPAAAPESEQDKRAAMLYARAGSAPWPVCGS